ncbi:DUF523 domain-containing protein [Peptoniphilus catoniae]|uniref:DUF523 domain-containing protein n=1 Tax=Peptoniphilus catoniae TaxID=1660341 RepID=UPI0010FE9825|nr:DUF523 domain-containing protein [Peptoniphilus catoniae]
MEKLLVSACLLGCKCRYDGRDNKIDLKYLKEKYEFVSCCPEVLSGMTIPREPAEILKDRVINKQGEDVTKYFLKGADKALIICEKNNIKKALMKEKSPSCGSSFVYDGSHSRVLIEGQGFTVRALREKGIEVYSEREIDKLL